jgi:Tol biopolymer transport system component
LQTGKVSELTEVKDDYLHWIIQMQVIDDAVYYNYNYYDDEMELTEEGLKEDSSEYLYSFIYKIDINTGVEEQVFDITECLYRYIGLDDKYIYLLSEDRSKVYSVNREDNSEKVLFEGESIGHAYKSSHYLIFIKDFSSEDGFDCYFYDLSTGKTTQVSRPDGEVMPDFIYEGWIVFSATLEDGTFTEVFMSIEDYLNGKTDYITIK